MSSSTRGTWSASARATLEPFNFEEADVSGELWFGEGFTSYYDDLIMRRTGLTPLEDTLASFAGTINAVTLSPGRQFRSAEEMSRAAPFVDAAASIDRTSWDNTFISYYTFGAALGLSLDLSLRELLERPDHARHLHAGDVDAGSGGPGRRCRAWWPRPTRSTISRPSSREVSGDKRFADTFFAEFVQGRNVVNYAPLLARAGLILRKTQRRHGVPRRHHRSVSRVALARASVGRSRSARRSIRPGSIVMI